MAHDVLLRASCLSFLHGEGKEGVGRDKRKTSKGDRTRGPRSVRRWPPGSLTRTGARRIGITPSLKAPWTSAWRQERGSSGRAKVRRIQRASPAEPTHCQIARWESSREPLDRRQRSRGRPQASNCASQGCLWRPRQPRVSTRRGQTHQQRRGPPAIVVAGAKIGASTQKRTSPPPSTEPALTRMAR